MNLNRLTNALAQNTVKTKTIVFLHGNSMNAICFNAQLESDLFASFNLVAIDLPGHGISGKLDQYSIPEILEVLDNELQGLKQVILVGHSLGGHIAIRLLPKLKDRCIGICLMGCPPLQTPLNVEAAYNLNETSAKFLQRDLTEEDISTLVELIYNSKNGMFNELMSSFKNTDGAFREGFAVSLSTDGLQDELEILNQFEGEVLMVYGEEDTLVNIDYINKLPLKSVSIVGLKNAGHSPHMESPEAFNKVFLDFVL